MSVVKLQHFGFRNSGGEQDEQGFADVRLAKLISLIASIKLIKLTSKKQEQKQKQKQERMAAN